jgi:hypothetical protein
MIRTINVDDLPEFDPAKYLDSEESIAVYLTGILEANDAALLASALGDIARARHNEDRHPALNLLNGRGPWLYFAEADLTDDSISRLRMAFMRD